MNFSSPLFNCFELNTLCPKAIEKCPRKVCKPIYLEITLLYIGCKKKNTLFPFKKVCDIFRRYFKMPGLRAATLKTLVYDKLSTNLR